MNIEETDWAKNFKYDCPTRYDDALKIVSQDVVNVNIIRTDELNYGVFLYAISNDDLYEDFWLDMREKKEDAIKLCEEMGWNYTINI